MSNRFLELFHSQKYIFVRDFVFSARSDWINIFIYKLPRRLISNLSSLISLLFLINECSNVKYSTWALSRWTSLSKRSLQMPPHLNINDEKSLFKHIQRQRGNTKSFFIIFLIRRRCDKKKKICHTTFYFHNFFFHERWRRHNARHLILNIFHSSILLIAFVVVVVYYKKKAWKKSRAFCGGGKSSEIENEAGGPIGEMTAQRFFKHDT